MNSQQFESTHNKLRAIIQAYLNSNNSWTANDFRNDTKESVTMEVDHISRGKGNGKGEGKGTKPDNQDKECHVRCESALRARLLVTSKPRQNS